MVDGVQAPVGGVAGGAAGGGGGAGAAPVDLQKAHKTDAFDDVSEVKLEDFRALQAWAERDLPRVARTHGLGPWEAGTAGAKPPDTVTLQFLPREYDAVVRVAELISKQHHPASWSRTWRTLKQLPFHPNSFGTIVGLSSFTLLIIATLMLPGRLAQQTARSQNAFARSQAQLQFLATRTAEQRAAIVEFADKFNAGAGRRYMLELRANEIDRLNAELGRLSANDARVAGLTRDRDELDGQWRELRTRDEAATSPEAALTKAVAQFALVVPGSGEVAGAAAPALAAGPRSRAELIAEATRIAAQLRKALASVTDRPPEASALPDAVAFDRRAAQLERLRVDLSALSDQFVDALTRIAAWDAADLDVLQSKPL